MVNTPLQVSSYMTTHLRGVVSVLAQIYIVSVVVIVMTGIVFT